MEGKYYKTQESVNEYIRLAKDVNGAFLINKLKEFLPNQSSILELGTGPGTDWNLLKEDYHVIGSDNSSIFLKHLRSNNPKGRFLELDASTLQTKEQFGGIYSNKVLHHLKEFELIASIKRQHEILNNSGIICHSFWRGQGSEMFKGLFVNYHSENDLIKYFNTYFEMILLEPYDEFETNDSLIFIGKKKE